MNDGTTKALLLGVAAATAMAGSAMGATVNLTNSGSSGTVNGVRFETWDMRSPSEGVTSSFLRLNGTGASQGYNTSARPLRFNEENSDGTRNVRLSDLVTRVVDGTSFFEITLDANEPTAAGQNTVSLDQLILYTNPIGSRVTSTVSTLGTVRYSLDEGGNNNIMIRDMNNGSADVRILVPTSFFDAAAPSDFLYLFARFGDASAAQGGAEEFSITSQNMVVIPLPTASGLAMLGLAGVCVRRRR